MYKLLFAVVALLCLNISSLALASGGSGLRTIGQVRADGALVSAVFPKSQSTFDNPDSCDASDYAIIQASASITAEAYQSMLSLALTALSAGYEVDLWLSGCAAGTGGSTRPVVWSVTIIAP